MVRDGLLSNTISYLRFPLTVGVVLIHFSLADGLIINKVQYGMDNPDWYFYIVRLFSEVLARICVPLFFVISGFLFFNRKEFNSSIYKQKLKTRFTTLFVPFILWNIIAILWKLKYLLPVISSYYRPLEFHFSFERLIYTFFCNSDSNGIIVGTPTAETTYGIYPIDLPLWYIRELMIMVIVSPVIYYIIKKAGKWLVTFLGITWLSAPTIISETNYADLLMTAVFFFSLGAFFGINGMDIVRQFRKIKFAPYFYIIFAIADTLTKEEEYNEYIHRLGILFGTVSAVIIVSYLLESGKTKPHSALASSSFFIYALHYLFIGDVGRFAFMTLHIPDSNPYAMLTLYFLIPVFAISVCIILYRLTKNLFPQICNLLTGHR